MEQRDSNDQATTSFLFMLSALRLFALYATAPDYKRMMAILNQTAEIILGKKEWRVIRAEYEELHTKKKE